MYQSGTPLEYVPINLEVLWLVNSELKIACEHLQISKISKLIVDKSSVDMKCLPKLYSLLMENTPQSHFSFSDLPKSIAYLHSHKTGLTKLNDFKSLADLSKLFWISFKSNKLGYFDLSYLPSNLLGLSLNDNKIQNINLKPLLSHSHLTQIDLTGNPLICTCETFFDFIHIAIKQSTDQLWIDCSPDSLLTGYPLRYGDSGSPWSATARLNKLQEMLEHDRDNMKCFTSEMTTVQTDDTTESFSAVNLPSASHCVTFSFTSIVLAVAVSFLVFFVLTF